MTRKRLSGEIADLVAPLSVRLMRTLRNSSAITASFSSLMLRDWYTLLRPTALMLSNDGSCLKYTQNSSMLLQKLTLNL